MKKVVLLLILLLLCLQPIPVFAASIPEILNDPQNLIWPENSVASYSVEAYGDNLNYKWYIICNGVTYDTTQFKEGQPWAGFGTSGCGASEDGKTFYINGIIEEANGAQIYCEVTNGAGSVRSRAATISVGGSVLPPNIKVVSNIVVELNQPASILCTATDPKGGSLEYTWMETGTGELRDVVAINRGEETNQTLNCDTGTIGTRYYVCMVTTSNGGMGYSSVVPVTVKEQSAEVPHQHKFGDWMVTAKPTCTESGIKIRECDCGHTEREAIPPTGHLWGEGTVTKLPTLESDGEKLYSCTVCNETKTEIIKAGQVDGEPTTSLVTDPGSADGSSIGEEPTSAFPWWAILIVCLLIGGAVVGVVVCRTKKKGVQ